MPILAYNLDLDLWECCPIAVSSAVETLGLCFVNCKGIQTLSDAGKWINNKSGKLTFAVSEDVATQTRWTPKAGDHWDNIATILKKMDMTWLFDGDPTLMMPRTQRQAEAEDYIRSLPSILSLPPSSLPHQNRT